MCVEFTLSVGLYIVHGITHGVQSFSRQIIKYTTVNGAARGSEINYAFHNAFRGTIYGVSWTLFCFRSVHIDTRVYCLSGRAARRNSCTSTTLRTGLFIFRPYKPIVPSSTLPIPSRSSRLNGPVSDPPYVVNGAGRCRLARFVPAQQ